MKLQRKSLSKKSTENLFISTAFIVGMPEIKNIGMVFSASFNERLSKEIFLRSNICNFSSADDHMVKY